MSTSPDYYEALQVSPVADPEVIEAAYRRLVDMWQADRRPGDPVAFDRLAALDTAYSVLSDPTKRIEYDAGRGERTEPSSVPGELRTAPSRLPGERPTPPTAWSHFVVLFGCAVVVSGGLLWALWPRAAQPERATASDKLNPSDHVSTKDRLSVTNQEPSLAWVDKIVPGASGKAQASIQPRSWVDEISPSAFPKRVAGEVESLPEADRAVSYLRDLASEIIRSGKSDDLIETTLVFEEFRRRFPGLDADAIRQRFEGEMIKITGRQVSPPPAKVSPTITREKKKPLAAQEIAKLAFASTVMLEMEDTNGKTVAIGSGFVVDDEMIASNLHVLAGATQGTVKLIGRPGKYLIMGAVAADSNHDLVILKTHASGATPLPLGDSDSVQVGDEVYAVGCPRGLEGTFSQGIVSGLRAAGRDGLIQVTAPISEGSSGGPLLNSDGMVVGVTTSMLTNGQNLNFAVPTADLVRLLRSNKGGDVTPIAAVGRTRKSDRTEKPIVEGQERIEMTVDNPRTLIGTTSKALSVCGLSLGLSHREAWRIIDDSADLTGIKDRYNPSRIYVYHKRLTGGQREAIFYLVWQPGETAMSQLTVFRGCRELLAPNFKRLMTFEAIDNHSSFKHEFIGYPSGSKSSPNFPELTLKLTSYCYENIGLEIIHSRDSQGEDVRFALVPPRP